jgi:hypothetical protein
MNDKTGLEKMVEWLGLIETETKVAKELLPLTDREDAKRCNDLFEIMEGIYTKARSLLAEEQSQENRPCEANINLNQKSPADGLLVEELENIVPEIYENRNITMPFIRPETIREILSRHKPQGLPDKGELK